MNAQFLDSSGNPISAGVRVKIFTGVNILGTLTVDQYFGVGSTTSGSLLSTSTQYTATFIGVQAPMGTVTFTTPSSGSLVTVTVPAYASPDLTQANYAAAQAALWPRGWFADAAKTTGGVAYNLAFALAWVLNQLDTQHQSVTGMMRLQSSITSDIDSWAYDFFGNTLPRFNQIGTPSGAPTLGSVSGGALAATTYFVTFTYTNAFGETMPSPEASLAVAASHLLTVTSPAAVPNASGYNVYVSTSTGTETKQNTSPIAIGTSWTEPTSGLIAGSAQPTRDTSTESDAAYISRIEANLGAMKATRSGLQTIANSYGTAVINEPFRTVETGAADGLTYTDGIGGAGDQHALVQVWVTPNSGVSTTQLKAAVLAARPLGLNTQVYAVSGSIGTLL